MAACIHTLNQLVVVAGISPQEADYCNMAFDRHFLSSIELMQDFTTLNLPYASTVIRRHGCVNFIILAQTVKHI